MDLDINAFREKNTLDENDLFVCIDSGAGGEGVNYKVSEVFVSGVGTNTTKAMSQDGQTDGCLNIHILALLLVCSCLGGF